MFRKKVLWIIVVAAALAGGGGYAAYAGGLTDAWFGTENAERKQQVQTARFLGGLLLIGAAALVFFLKVPGLPLPVAITLLIVGIALVATARKRR